MPVNQKSKNHITTFIEAMQTLSDEKFNTLTRSSLKSSKRTVHEKIEKYLRKALRGLLFDMSQIKITKLTNEIIEKLFESQKNFDRLLEEECYHLSRLMPFLQNDQIKGTALENAGFKTICGELDRKALIERYTLNEVTIPDQIPKEAKNQKVGWNERVTVFELEEKTPMKGFQGFEEADVTGGLEELEDFLSSRKSIGHDLQRELKNCSKDLSENEALNDKVDDNKVNEAESSCSFINADNSFEFDEDPEEEEDLNSEKDSNTGFQGFDPEDFTNFDEENANHGEPPKELENIDSSSAFKGFEPEDVDLESPGNSQDKTDGSSASEDLDPKGSPSPQKSLKFLEKIDDSSALDSFDPEGANPQKSSTSLEKIDGSSALNNFDPEGASPGKSTTPLEKIVDSSEIKSSDPQDASQNLETIPGKENPSEQSSIEEDEDEISTLEFRREMYSKAPEENFLFGQRQSDDEEIPSVLSLPDDSNFEAVTENPPECNPKKRKCSETSLQLIHRHPHPPSDFLEKGEKKFKGQEFESDGFESSPKSR